MIINVKKTTKLENINHDIVLGTEFSVRSDKFTTEEIIQIKNNFKNKVYISVDKLIHQFELERLKLFLEKLSFVDGIYFSDFAVFTIAKNLGITSKLVYNTGTLSTSSIEIDYLLNLGIKRICLSRELTLEELKVIIKNNPKVEVMIHGKVNMFYSRRDLLSSYFNYKNMNQDKLKFTLKEEIRDELYFIEQDDTGTHIYNENVLNSYDEVRELKCTLRIDGYFLTDEELLEEIKIYETLLNGEEVVFDKTSKNSGFYYKETKEVKE